VNGWPGRETKKSSTLVARTTAGAAFTTGTPLGSLT
jgi:hypothetical protein